MQTQKIKLSFPLEPYYGIEASKETGKIVTTCCLPCVLKIPGTNASIPHEILFSMGDEHAFYAIGKAVCNEKDAYNEAIGKKVALANAESKAYLKAAKLAKKYAHKAYKQREYAINAVADFASKALDIVEHNDNYLAQFKKNPS